MTRSACHPVGFVPLAALVGVAVLATHVHSGLRAAAGVAEAAAGVAGRAAEAGTTLPAGLAGRGEPWQLAFALGSLLLALALVFLPEARIRRVVASLDHPNHHAKGTP